MSFPKYNEMFLPILEELNDKKAHTVLELEGKLASKFNLSVMEIDMLKSTGSERLFLNRVRWAKTYLSMARLVNSPKRGFVKLTKQGKKTLSSKPKQITEKFLRGIPEYFEKRYLKIKRVFAMPNKWTFSIPPIKKLLKNEVNGVSIDPFSGKSDIAKIRNDLNPKSNSQYHLDSLEFLKKLKSFLADIILLDGPYTPGQMKECYESLKLKLNNYQTNHRYFADIKNEIARVTKIGGKVISFGYNSNGLGFKRGFAKELILLVSHGAGHNDTIVTVERKIK